MPCKASDIITLAKTQIGVHETPAGSNNVIYNTEYYNREINDPAYGWCVVFGWWLFKHCGAPELFYDGQKTASCSVIDYWARTSGLAVGDPQPGDVVLFNWDGNSSPDHYGIIIRLEGDKLITVEGNVGDAVKQMTRTRDKVFRFIRPKYQPETPQPDPGDQYVTRSEVRTMLQQALDYIS